MLAQKRNKIMYTNMFSNFLLFPIGHLTHPPTSKVFLDFWNFFLFTWPLNRYARSTHFHCTRPVFLLILPIYNFFVISSRHLRPFLCGFLSFLLFEFITSSFLASVYASFHQTIILSPTISTEHRLFLYIRISFL